MEIWILDSLCVERAKPKRIADIVCVYKNCPSIFVRIRSFICVAVADEFALLSYFMRTVDKCGVRWDLVEFL